MDRRLSQTDTTESLDLRSFLRACGGLLQRGGPSAGARTDFAGQVGLLDDGPQEVHAEPLGIASYIDGIQASRTVAYRDGRPVQLQYIGVGAIDTQWTVRDMREELRVVASTADEGWLEPRLHGLPVRYLDITDPGDVQVRCASMLREDRDRHEQELVEQLLPRTGAVVAVDGSIARQRHPDCVGIVKTTRTRYLPEETQLHTLPRGHRSARFRIGPSPSARRAGANRYSCYLRLLDAQNRQWNFALVRLEANDPGLLDPLAAAVLGFRKAADDGDPRYDRHLQPVWQVEEWMRARRPPVFDMP